MPMMNGTFVSDEEYRRLMGEPPRGTAITSASIWPAAPVVASDSMVATLETSIPEPDGTFDMGLVPMDEDAPIDPNPVVEQAIREGILDEPVQIKKDEVATIEQKLGERVMVVRKPKAVAKRRRAKPKASPRITLPSQAERDAIAEEILRR